MVSTVASGDVKPYVGPSDICMMYSVTDVAGINRISERVLAQRGRTPLAGMIGYGRTQDGDSSVKPALGLTQFGVTTPCVQAVTKALEARLRLPRVPRPPGTGGQSMEKLVDSGLLTGVIDVTTTEDRGRGSWAGVLSAGTRGGSTRSSARGVPYVGSCGALDMANLLGHGHRAPPSSAGRNLYRHNPNVTPDAHHPRRVAAASGASSSRSSTAWRARCGS